VTTASTNTNTTSTDIEVMSRSAADTQALAARIQPLLRAGDVILLGGDLGAGKTAFVQGLAQAMGVEGVVTSPTFTLVRTYDGAAGLALVHADMYRLDHLQEVVDLGFSELLDDGAVAAIEWGDMAAPVLSRDCLEVRIDLGQGDDDRVLRMTPVGARWAERAAALREAAAGGGGGGGGGGGAAP
jgi:tRNA threonylcarbamoyladenosine biosynthesis protein TsaE